MHIHRVDGSLTTLYRIHPTWCPTQHHLDRTSTHRPLGGVYFLTTLYHINPLARTSKPWQEFGWFLQGIIQWKNTAESLVVFLVCMWVKLILILEPLWLYILLIEMAMNIITNTLWSQGGRFTYCKDKLSTCRSIVVYSLLLLLFTCYCLLVTLVVVNSLLLLFTCCCLLVTLVVVRYTCTVCGTDGSSQCSSFSLSWCSPSLTSAPGGWGPKDKTLHHDYIILCAIYSGLAEQFGFKSSNNPPSSERVSMEWTRPL